MIYGISDIGRFFFKKRESIAGVNTNPLMTHFMHGGTKLRGTKLSYHALEKAVHRQVKELEKGETVSHLTDDMMGKTALEERNILTQVKMLSRGILKRNVSKTSACRIVAAISFWEYACNTYSLNLLFDSHSRAKDWSKLAKISRIKRKEIMAIIRSWDERL